MLQPRSFLAHAAVLALLALAPPRLAAQDDLAAQVAAICARHLERPGAVGLSVGVGKKGAVLNAAGYGRADLEFDVPADAATMFRIGSVTKQFTAAAVLRCAGRGALALEDPLSKYVPEFPTGEHVVTLRQLLTHTSGIPSYTDAGEAWERTRPLELTHQELLAVVAGKPFDFDPGTGWRYSNTGYYLLGMVLEKVAGAPYAKIVQDELAAPLGLERTRYDSNTELIRNRAQGYALRDGVLGNDDALGTSQPGAAGALLSTGGDLVRWSMALSGGKVVTPEQFVAMTTPVVLPNGRDTRYGFGLKCGELEGRKCVQHGGGIDGFNSMLLWLPDADVHVAVISNGERLSSARVANEIACAVAGIEKQPVQDLPIDAALRQQLVGDYRIAELELDVAVSEQDETLVLQPKGQHASRLLWQGKREFRAAFDNAVRVVFGEDGKSFELHQGGGTFLGARKP